MGDLVEVANRLRDRRTALVGISGDSVFSHQAFARAHGVTFPLLSDIHRRVMRSYDALDEDRNVAWRSTFIVDRDGVLRWGQLGDRHMVRDGAEILRVLDLVERLRG